MKKKIICLAVILLAFSMLTIKPVNSSGVSSPIWPGNPKIVYPGEKGEIILTIRNMVGNEDITFLVTLIQNDGEIAKIKEGEYFVPAETDSTEVLVNYEIPENAEFGTEYTVKISFQTATGSGDGGLQMETGMDIVLPFILQSQPPSTSPPLLGISITTTLTIITTTILIGIIVVLVLKRRKNTVTNPPVTANLT